MCNYIVLNDGEQDGESALMIAAGRGFAECVSALVSLGADVNLANKVLIWL